MVLWLHNYVRRINQPTHIEHDPLRVSSAPSNSNVLTSETTAAWMVWICCATTDNTSISIRLNSSKQDHAPDCKGKNSIRWFYIWLHFVENLIRCLIIINPVTYTCARPLRNLAMALKSIPSEQLKTTHCLATALDKSYIIFKVDECTDWLSLKRRQFLILYQISYLNGFCFPRSSRTRRSSAKFHTQSTH